MKRKTREYIVLGITIVLALIFAVPIYLIIINSFKSYGQIFSDPVAFPWHPTLENFIKVWNETNFIRYFFNTVISTTVGLVVVVFVSSLASYKLSRTKTVLSKVMFFYFTVSMLLPFEVIMLPLVMMLKNFGMLNNLFSLGVIQASTSIAFSIFLYHGFVKSIPTTLDEAARIDGCGEFRLFWTIIMPLLKPITSTVIILNILSYWNSFLLPLLTLTKEEIKTLPLFAYSFLGQYSSNYDMQLPAVILTGLPLVIFYLFMQKNIVKGITASSVKG
ncbi:MAG: carbohydrate ABC transporter permease [Clostridiales bacterium]|nr:carbohydrate ABC transporter permease [Clostridiales bacterium]